MRFPHVSRISEMVMSSTLVVLASVSRSKDNCSASVTFGCRFARVSIGLSPFPFFWLSCVPVGCHFTLRHSPRHRTAAWSNSSTRSSRSAYALTRPRRRFAARQRSEPTEGLRSGMGSHTPDIIWESLPRPSWARQTPHVRLLSRERLRIVLASSLNLSLTGAQIEHLDLLRPGLACTLDLLSPCGALSLPAQVVWCAVVGRKRKVGSGTHLVSRSGLRFPTFTAARHAALADSVQQLTAALQPILDSQRRSA